MWSANLYIYHIKHRKLVEELLNSFFYWKLFSASFRGWLNDECFLGNSAFIKYSAIFSWKPIKSRIFVFFVCVCVSPISSMFVLVFNSCICWHKINVYFANNPIEENKKIQLTYSTHVLIIYFFSLQHRNIQNLLLSSTSPINSILLTNWYITWSKINYAINKSPKNSYISVLWKFIISCHSTLLP